MLEEELKDIKDKSNFKKLEKLRNSLRNMVIIHFSCVFFIIISVISIVCNYTTSSINPLNITISTGGILAVFIFFLISKPINKRKSKFKSNYYDIVLLPIIRKVNSNWVYREETNVLEIFRDYIVSGFQNTNIDKFFLEKSIKGKLEGDINIQIHQINLIDIVGYGQHRKLKKIFNGIFAIVDTNIHEDFHAYIEVTSGSIKICDSLNNSKIRNLVETFCNSSSLDFDLVIKNNKIYFRIFSGNKFKEHLFNKLIIEKEILDYYNTLKFIKEISNEINNTEY